MEPRGETYPGLDKVEAPMLRGFHDAVVKLLTDESAGSMATESVTTHFGSSAITVTGEPSDDELLQEIQRLRDVATGSPEEAEGAELRSVRQDLERMRHQRNSFRRAFEELAAVQHELTDVLNLWTELPGGAGSRSVRQSPLYQAVVAEVRRLKALDS